MLRVQTESAVADPLSSDLASLRIDRGAPSATRSYVRTLVILAVVGALSAVAYVGVVPRLKGELFQQEVQITEVSMVSPVQSTVTVTSTGYVVPQVISKVGAKIAGRVVRVAVKEGDIVKAGALIAQLDDADQRSAIAAAVSRVAVARAHVQTARANLADMDQQSRREEALVKSGAAGRATLEDLEAKQASLSEQVKASESEANAAQSDVDSLRTNLLDRTIVSPIDGTIVTKPVEVGETVTPAGNPVAEVADFKSLLVETDVPEGRLHLVKKGSPAEIVLDAYPERRYRGEVTEFGQRVDRAKATIIVKVRFIDSLDDVLPEMAARVSFLTQPIAKDSLAEKPKRVVPANAVIDRDGAKSVFVIAEGKLRLTRVTLGGAVGSGFELVDGPAAGTKIVSSPRAELADGQSIKEKGT
jgi:RND family efflux transporter MFP subunit